MAKLKITVEVPVYCSCGEILKPSEIEGDHGITVKTCVFCMREQYNIGYRKGIEFERERANRKNVEG